MGRHDIAWPAARPVEEVSVFARLTSEGAAPKDRPPPFSEGRIEVVGGAVARRPARTAGQPWLPRQLLRTLAEGGRLREGYQNDDPLRGDRVVLTDEPADEIPAPDL